MAQIIRGTTPTIEFTFKIVDVTNISTAILTIKQGSQLLVEKDKTSATVGDKTLSWNLTQEESLAVKSGFCRVMLNWVLADGTRGASNEAPIEMVQNHIPEVIT